MSSWLGFAVGAAILYGLHQVFTKLASTRASDGLGGFIVEISATARNAERRNMEPAAGTI